MPDISSFNSSVSSMTISNSVNVGAILTIVICLVSAITLFMLLTSLERYTKFADTLYKILYTLKYTAVGCGVSVAGYGMYLGCSALVSIGGGIDPVLVLGVILAYIIITILGYVAVKVLERIKSMHTSYVASKVVA